MDNWLIAIATAAMAIATGFIAQSSRRQAAFAKKLADLQESFEADRKRVELFVRIRREPTPGTHGAAYVDVANLSGVGVWLESVLIEGDIPHGPLKPMPVPLERVVGAFAADRERIDHHIRWAVEHMGDLRLADQPVTATVKATLYYRVHGQDHREQSARYEVETFHGGSSEVRCLAEP